MPNEPLPLDLVAMNEHVRGLIQKHPNRSQLSLDAQVKYGTLTNFALNPGSTMSLADLQRLMEHFGLARPPVAA